MKPLITLIQQNKALTLAFCAVGLFCLGIHLYTQWDTARFEAQLGQPKPASSPPPETSAAPSHTAGGHWHGDEWHAEPHAAPSPTTETAAVAAEHPDNSFPVPWSNPLMPDEIPEHFKMPLKWEHLDYMAIDERTQPIKYAQIEERLRHLMKAVIENYNPKRPIEEVWPVLIEDEKQYHANSEHSKKYPLPVLGGFRADWYYQEIWNCPEVYELIMDEEPSTRWMDVYHVEMGVLDPDWNRFHLQDGREFRVRNDKHYEFHIGYDEETGEYTSSYSFSLTNPDTAETIHVYPETMSDAELEALQGWNYNFNPYTGKPISR